MKKSTFIAIVVIIVVVLSALSAVAQDSSLGEKYIVSVVDDNEVKLVCGDKVITLSVENSGTYTDGDVIFVKSSQSSKSVKTDKTFTDTKGVVYPVWKSVNGKLYYNKVSKNTGKEYKVYINTIG